MSILRDLITEAMEIKAKRHEEQQRELEEEEENSVRNEAQKVHILDHLGHF